MKAVVDKIEEVAEGLRGEYVAGEGGKFYLKLEGLEEGTGHPAVGELVRAKKREADTATAKAAEAAKFKTERDEAQEALHKRLQGKVDKSDLEALDRSYLKKLEDADTASKAREGALSASLREVLVDQSARSIAAGIALDTNAADLLAESIQRRLAVEITTEGKAVARVLGLDGKPSAASLDDLKKEIVATPKYHALLSGSKASGSGASGGQGASGAGNGNGSANWLTGNPTELAAAAAKQFAP